MRNYMYSLIFVDFVIDLQDNGRCFLFVHCYFYILYEPCKFSIS